MEVPHVQYGARQNDGVLVIQTCRRPWSSHRSSTLTGSLSQLQHQAPTIQSVRKTVDVPQSQHLDRVPAGSHCQVPTIQTVHMMVEVPQSQHLDRVPAGSHCQVPTIQTVHMMVGVPQSHCYDRVEARAVATQPQSSTMKVTRTAEFPKLPSTTVARVRRRTQSIRTEIILLVTRVRVALSERSRHLAELMTRVPAQARPR